MFGRIAGVFIAFLIPFTDLGISQSPIAALAIVPGLVAALQAQRAGTLQAPFASWAFWVLLCLVPVLAMSAFHRDAPPAARWSWLAALPVGYLLVGLPLLAVLATGDTAWLPDLPGASCSPWPAARARWRR